MNISKKRIILDPGIGFAKTLDHNFIILKNLSIFLDLGHPLMIGVSRKSLIKCLTKNNKSELLCSTIELVKTPPTLSNNKSESFTNYNNHFNIYCRPPPLIVS